MRGLEKLTGKCSESYYRSNVSKLVEGRFGDDCELAQGGVCGFGMRTATAGLSQVDVSAASKKRMSWQQEKRQQVVIPTNSIQGGKVANLGLGRKLGGKERINSIGKEGAGEEPGRMDGVCPGRTSQDAVINPLTRSFYCSNGVRGGTCRIRASMSVA